jgi:hypothetical protein
MVQLDLPAQLEPQVFRNTNEEAFAPTISMLKIASGALPMLVTVTGCNALGVPISAEPKFVVPVVPDPNGVKLAVILSRLFMAIVVVADEQWKS